MGWAKFQAKAVLGWLFFIHLIKRVLFFWKRPPGLPVFLKIYASDAIAPVTDSERSRFPHYTRCQGCSQCTFSCEGIKQGRAPASFEPKFIMLGYGRSSHEAEYFLEDWLPCVQCKECTVHCPNDVPIHEMATQVMERRNRLGFRASQRDSIS
jgi:heterodisulfide reductase subunit C